MKLVRVSTILQYSSALLWYWPNWYCWACKKAKANGQEKKNQIIVPAVLYVYMINMKIQIKSNLEKKREK